MGLFNLDWNSSSSRRHTARTSHTTNPLSPHQSTRTRKPSLISRLLHPTGTRTTPRSKSVARPSGTRRSRAGNGVGISTTNQRRTRTRRSHATGPVAALTPNSGNSTALGSPRRKTGLFDSMLGRSRHRRTTAHASATTGPRLTMTKATKPKTANRPWLHPRHQRAPTPHTGLGDKVLGTVTRDEGKRKRGERKRIWASNVRKEERGRRGRPVFT